MSGESSLFKRGWETVVYYGSGEWLLVQNGSNGGALILLRSLVVAIELTCISLLLRNLIDPDLTDQVSWTAFRTQLIEIAPWFAAATGAVYAALYARFSAQWSYLAGLYNQIKQAELEMYNASPASAEGLKRLAEWKAGYIEDAQSLHLHAKENVAAVVHHWGKNPLVAEAFANTTPGGSERWSSLQRSALIAYEKAAKRYSQES
ncbi:hypothetical protein RAE21_03825 [Rhodoferax sp. TBRC 17198]|jgi:hypothetical protein|uniref:hypothetical protein n=1 Tax=Rhodoferax potami TaxID=3068338 RepID=UPI0028BE113A|nr:hypothetical protein [Rhodoferax sp. TBRC 17198]MDT7521541.1 hypothetical protein [Rhodoferax sp. TBRC 17198]